MDKLEIIELTAAEYNTNKIEEILDKVSKQTVLYAIHAGYAGVENTPTKYRRILRHALTFDYILESTPTVMYDKGGFEIPITSYNITVFNIYKEPVLEIKLKT